MNTISTQTNSPKDLDLKVIRTLAENLKKSLLKKYYEYYYQNIQTRKLAEDERQLILSFAFPKMTREYRSEVDAVNYCMCCRKYKYEDEMTNKFCLEKYDVNSDWYSDWNHRGYALCYECLEKKASYGISHHDNRYIPCCPCCGSAVKFHYINPSRLFLSHPAQSFIIDQVLTWNGTTTKKMTVSVNRWASGRGRNQLKLFDHKVGGNVIIKMNSYGFKFSMLHTTISTLRDIFVGNNTAFERITEWDGNRQHEMIYLYPMETRATLRGRIDAIKNMVDNNLNIFAYNQYGYDFGGVYCSYVEGDLP